MFFQGWIKVLGKDVYFYNNTDVMQRMFNSIVMVGLKRLGIQKYKTTTEIFQTSCFWFWFWFMFFIRDLLCLRYFFSDLHFPPLMLPLSRRSNLSTFHGVIKWIVSSWTLTSKDSKTKKNHTCSKSHLELTIMTLFLWLANPIYIYKDKYIKHIDQQVVRWKIYIILM